MIKLPEGLRILLTMFDVQIRPGTIESPGSNLKPGKAETIAHLS